MPQPQQPQQQNQNQQALIAQLVKMFQSLPNQGQGNGLQKAAASSGQAAGAPQQHPQAPGVSSAIGNSIASNAMQQNPNNQQAMLQQGVHQANSLQGSNYTESINALKGKLVKQMMASNPNMTPQMAHRQAQQLMGKFLNKAHATGTGVANPQGPPPGGPMGPNGQTM